MNQDNQGLDELASMEESYSPRPHTLIVVNPLNRARVEKAYEALGLPAPYVARNMVEGGEQAKGYLYDIVISDIKHISDLAQKAGIAVDSRPGRGFIDADAPDLAQQLRGAVYSKYFKVLVLEAEKPEEYQKALEGVGQVVMAADESSAASLLREGGIDLVVIGRGSGYSEGVNMHGFTTIHYTGATNPGIPVILESDAEHTASLKRTAIPLGAYDVIARSEHPIELAEKAREALEVRRPKALEIGKRILYVSEGAKQAQSNQRALRAEGYALTVISSVRDFVQMVAQGTLHQEIDLIIAPHIHYGSQTGCAPEMFAEDLPGIPVILETHQSFLELEALKYLAEENVGKGYRVVPDSGGTALYTAMAELLNIEYGTTRPFSAEAEAKSHAEHGHSEAILVTQEEFSEGECPEAELVASVEKPVDSGSVTRD